MRSAAARAELPAWCSKHDVEFVQFTNGRNGKGIQRHFGCPICVAKIRDDVRALRASFKAQGYGRRYNRVRKATGKRKPR